MPYLIAALLSVYFLFFLNRAVTSEFLGKLRAFDAYDWISIAFIPFLLLISNVLARRYRQGRFLSREIFWLSILLVTFTFLSVALVVSEKNASVILFGVYLATLGWLYTNYTNVANQRKTHTMNVLLQMRNSAEFQKNRANISSVHPMGQPIQDDDLPELLKKRTDPASYADGKTAFLDSVVYILNYYEFISVGVYTDDLDENMITLTLRAIFITFHDHVEPYIRYTRKRNPAVYKNYVALVTKFRSITPSS